MKVYNKNDNIMCYGKNIFTVMDNFFSVYPSDYSRLYYNNLETLSFIKTRNINNGISSAIYDADDNIIYFEDYNSLGHEMFHVASNDITNKVMGIDGRGNKPSALLEGMTENLFIKTYNITNKYAYSFEVLVSKMLELMPDFYKYYFIPNNKKFLEMFSYGDTVLELMEDLDEYEHINDYFLGLMYLDGCHVKLPNDLKVEIACMIEAVINDLVNIGMENSDKINKNIYGNRLIKLLGDDNIRNIFKIYYQDYMEYANDRVRKLVK